MARASPDIPEARWLEGTPFELELKAVILGYTEEPTWDVLNELIDECEFVETYRYYYITTLTILTFQIGTPEHTKKLLLKYPKYLECIVQEPLYLRCYKLNIPLYQWLMGNLAERFPESSPPKPDLSELVGDLSCEHNFDELLAFAWEDLELARDDLEKVLTAEWHMFNRISMEALEWFNTYHPVVFEDKILSDFIDNSELTVDQLRKIEWLIEHFVHMNDRDEIAKIVDELESC